MFRLSDDDPNRHNLSPLLGSWELTLEGENKSPRTIGSYLEGMNLFVRWLNEEDRYPDLEPGEITAEMCRAWIAWLVVNRSASTGRTRWAALRQFFAWAYAEDEIESNPMELVKQPTVHQAPIDILRPEEVRALLATCKGQSFIERRDQAILVLMLDTGLRNTAVATAQLGKVDLRGRTIEVVEKGRKVQVQPFGVAAARALDRYLRARAKHPRAHVSTSVFISTRDGRGMDRNSVLQMVYRRSKQAGLKRIHPHVFRHTFTDNWLRAGGSEGDLMELNGWSSRDMLGRYAKATRAERAREAHRSLSPMDNLDEG